jgi:ADP-ribose pyrophosphatase YjhB (NUDIX family)
VARKKEAPAKTAVRALIFSSRGEVLLIRDASDERSPDKWLTPGEWLGGRAGTAAGLRRLVKQKLHIDVLVDRRPCDPVFDGKRHVEYRIFSAHPRRDMPAPKGDIWSAGWFTRDELRWHWRSLHAETKLLLKAAGFVEGP